MTAEASRWQNWQRASLLGLLFAATSSGAVATCDPRPTSLLGAYVSELSAWSEFDSSGRRLVRESGKLHGTEFSMGWRCFDWDVSATLSQLRGSRSYEGETSTGVPAVSLSNVRKSYGHLQGNFRITDRWHLGGRLATDRIWRDIASASEAAGYPERFDLTMISFGTQLQTVIGPGNLTLSAWLGKPATSRMTLNLPGRDQATLPLGSVLQLEMAAAWRSRISSTWQWQADVRYRRTDMGQGEDAVIRRGGIPVGLAKQPRTSMVDVPLTVGVACIF